MSHREKRGGNARPKKGKGSQTLARQDVLSKGVFTREEQSQSIQHKQRKKEGPDFPFREGTGIRDVPRNRATRFICREGRGKKGPPHVPIVTAGEKARIKSNQETQGGGKRTLEDKNFSL